jgi:hypothetical protein
MNRRTFLKTVPVTSLATAGLCADDEHLQPEHRELACDVAIIGGGTGGVAAALGALRNGMRVVLTEETDWIGGQLTAQSVPPDEHPWIESYGCTRSYRAYRNEVRYHYRHHFPLTEQARAKRDLNPGNGSVSRLTHEPKVSVAVLQAMLAPYIHRGELTVVYYAAPLGAETHGDRITSVTVTDTRNGGRAIITAKYFIDATETGELLPLTKTEFVTGSEAQSQTGELHASSEARPGNVQSFTYSFAMDYLEGEDHIIDRPRDYGFWRDYIPRLSPPWTGKLLSWTCPDPRTLRPRQLFFDPRQGASAKGLNLWIYRRIVDPANFAPGTYKSAVTLVNWPQNDYWLGDLLSASPQQKTKYLECAKQLSLSWLYWMQTDAPRADGRAGWKGLRLRKDVVDTADGLAKSPYIRESRRIQAEFTVAEQHVGREARQKAINEGEGLKAAIFHDTVGIGYYRLDLHPSTGGDNYIDISSLPFQIPMGALIPKRMENLLPGCKNLGTTHITNGCYRLHPVEWNIGEASGVIAAHAIRLGATPRAIRSSPQRLAALQQVLEKQGFELSWPDTAIANP